MPDDEDVPRWQPLNTRDTPAATEYEALAEGIPEWLERSLWRWAMDRAVRVPDMNYKAERLLKLRLPQSHQYRSAFDLYWEAADDAERLALIDFFLHDLEEVYEQKKHSYDGQAQTAERAALDLMRILQEGGSVWRLTVEPY